jgi:hypothetical protein
MKTLVGGGRRGRGKKVVGIPSWFSQHYSSHLRSLRTFFRTEKCPDCKYKSSTVKRDKNRVMVRHLSTHLEKKLPCPNCPSLFSHVSNLSHHRKIGCGVKKSIPKEAGSGSENPIQSIVFSDSQVVFIIRIYFHYENSSRQKRKTE